MSACHSTSSQLRRVTLTPRRSHVRANAAGSPHLFLQKRGRKSIGIWWYASIFSTLALYTIVGWLIPLTDDHFRYHNFEPNRNGWPNAKINGQHQLACSFWQVILLTNSLHEWPTKRSSSRALKTKRLAKLLHVLGIEGTLTFVCLDLI